MKTFLKLLINKWVIGIIGLLALSFFIWLIADFIKFGEDNLTLSHGTRWLIIAFIWLIWLTWMVATTLFERRQNKSLVAGLEQQADTPLSATDEKSQSEAEELQHRFSDALKHLQTSRFSFAGGSRSLYQLPWYIIIGPPGSGKTTALVNSGLEFPLADITGQYKLQGVRGTRNCDWWFTNDAVLIDTAGRYTTQDSHKAVDQSAWVTFLNLLKKFRSRRPINGVLLTVSIQDLLLSTPEQRQLQAKTLRTRIDEIQQNLGIRAPVYVILTKMDLIAGFSEFFADLSKNERNQVWGMTLPLNAEQPTHLFRHEFSLLVKRLHQRVLTLVNSERVVARKTRIQNFPERFSELNETLLDFLNNTFSANRYGTTPLLRGVYFSSGTQEGMPIDRMMAHMNSAFNVKATATPQENTGKSFFVYTLFKHVIFPESELVGSNKRIETFIRWGRRGTMVALLAMIVGSITIWTSAITKNKILLNQVETLITEHKTASKQPAIKMSTLLDNLNLLRTASNIYNKSDQSYLTGLGLYSDGVDDAADKLYQQALNTQLLPHFAQQVLGQMEALTIEDPRLLSSLKTYLMLFNTDKREADQILAYASDYADTQLHITAEQKEQWITHLTQLLSQPLSDTLTYNERAIASARQKLLQIPPALRLYENIKTTPLFSQPVDLYRRIGGDTFLIFGISNQDPVFKIAAAFTKEGFDKLDFSSDSPLTSNYFDQQWIWGDDEEQKVLNEKEKAAIAEQLQQLYLSDYSANWQRVLNGLNLAPATNLTQLTNQLHQLANPATSPIKGLIELANQNTKFSHLLEGAEETNSGVSLTTGKPRINPVQMAKAAKASAIGAWNDQQNINLVEKQFKPLHALSVKSERSPAPLDDYLDALNKLNEYLMQISAAPSPDEAAAGAAQKRFMGSTDDPIAQLQLKAKHAPRPLNTYLNGLARNAWELLMGYGKRDLDRAWADQVLPDCQRIVDSRFPFDPKSTLDTYAIGFNEMFGKGGILQSFIDNNLGSYIDTNRWTVKSTDGYAFPIKQSTLLQFKRAGAIQKAFFSGSDVASIQLQVTPAKLDSNVRLFTLEVGSTPIAYSHGPRTPKPLQWTLGETTRARILFEDLDEVIHQKQYDGEWAWFRMLNDMQNRPAGSSRSRNVTFSMNGLDSTYRFVSNTGEDPLDLSLFSQFKCPSSL